MEDGFEIEMSPLSCQLTADGKTVHVDIIRGDEGGWNLEMIDEFGVSTIWDDEFDTDVAALNEAKKVIREEGIDAFVGPL